MGGFPIPFKRGTFCIFCCIWTLVICLWVVMYDLQCVYVPEYINSFRIIPQKTIAITFSAEGAALYFLCSRVMFFHVTCLLHFKLIGIIHVSFKIHERKSSHLPYTSKRLGSIVFALNCVAWCQLQWIIPWTEFEYPSS